MEANLKYPIVCCTLTAVSMCIEYQSLDLLMPTKSQSCLIQ